MPVINKPLQPHQQEAADFFIKIYKTYNGALCSDEMGLGKSLMALYVAFKITESNQTQPILIVSPLSAQEAWLEQLSKHLDETSFDQFVYKKTADFEKLKKQIQISKKNDKQLIVLVTYGLFSSHQHAIPTSERLGTVVDQWGFQIFDEIHSIKNESSNRTNDILKLVHYKSSSYRLGMSGTPCSNSAQTDLFSICNVLHPTNQSSRTKKVNKRYKDETLCKTIDTFKSYSSLPSIFKKSHYGRKIESISNIHLPAITHTNILSTFQIPDEKEKYQHILKTLDGLHTALYFEKKNNQNKKKIDELTEKMMHKLTQLSVISTHYKIFELKKKVAETAKDTVHKLYAETPISTKETLVINLLKKWWTSKTNERIIVNSRYTTFLDILHAHLLTETKIPADNVFRYDGKMSQSKRTEVLKHWKNKTCSKCLLLMSTTAGNTGITLIEASKMISVDILSAQNPDIGDQVEGRIYRIGQTKDVVFSRLAITGSLDTALGLGGTHKFKREKCEQLLGRMKETTSKPLKKPYWFYELLHNWNGYYPEYCVIPTISQSSGDDAKTKRKPKETADKKKKERNNSLVLYLLKNDMNEMLTRMGKNKIEQLAEKDTQEKYTRTLNKYIKWILNKKNIDPFGGLGIVIKNAKSHTEIDSKIENHEKQHQLLTKKK